MTKKRTKYNNLKNYYFINRFLNFTIKMLIELIFKINFYFYNNTMKSIFFFWNLKNFIVFNFNFFFITCKLIARKNIGNFFFLLKNLFAKESIILKKFKILLLTIKKRKKNTVYW